MKLTDTQLVLLSGASQRDDGCLQIPETLKGGAAKKVADKLLSAGLAAEVPAGSSRPVWRRDEQEGSIALQITDAGLKAIRADEPGPEQQAPEKRKKASPRKSAPRKPKARTAQLGSPKAHTGSKQNNIIELLRRPQGTTIAAIHEGHRLAAALGARLLCRGCAQKAQAETRLREEGWRTCLPHRRQIAL